MQPSSLIFLVIIGIWAAYFVQYWVRRREHLATIRSVDAFSETMRVLQRRAPLPSVDHGGQAPRTYAVSPARAMRPQVTVKRAEAHVAAPVEQIEHVEVVEPVAATHVGMRPNRATRGTVVLIGLAGTVIFGLLSALGVLVSWSFVVPLAMAAGGFVWLRAGVQAEMKALRAARGRARRAAARTSAPAPRVSAPVAESSPPMAAPSPQRSADVVANEPAVEPVLESAPFDVATEVAASAASSSPAADEVAELPPVAQHEVALPELDEDDIPLTWDPRPVPRPTYTMKAKAAERPAPTREAEPEARAEHPAYDEVLQRRTAGG
ncbi:hypothetical protein [Janibacter sp. HTCC2649]|uniref:hypothetical protein n=1 Tax=Janibacter sp. HTCC2649 TaxID=313589 RepID=UPI00031EAD47|nr:hypothetical protein [Janibacter sp. HTCC2649]